MSRTKPSFDYAAVEGVDIVAGLCEVLLGAIIVLTPVAAGLGVLFYLVRFVKWAWQ